MKVLVTGANGYIGSLLAPLLMERGHDVTGLDTDFYTDGLLYEGVAKPKHWIIRDTRSVTVDDLRGFDAVVHLAELSNDPLGQLRPDITYKINHIGGVELARMAKEAGVQRFVYSSSCSVYGLGEDGLRTEESAVDPQTAYARCKVLVEQDVSKLADDNFSPTFMRNATAYGPSPRMRFDLVVNNLAGLAWTIGEIRMTSDGTPWRPLVHTLDISGAMASVLDASREVVHNQVFNVGNTSENYRVREVAQIISETFPGCQLTFGKRDADNRSYRVSFAKIAATLPGFKTRYTVRDGSEQLREMFERIGMNGDLFGFRAYTRLKQLEHLIQTDQIDGDFFWRRVPVSSGSGPQRPA